MAVAPLLAPAGVEMRVVSQAAAFTWGSWSVSWPEGYEPPDPPAEDRELGWVADLGGAEVEPFGRCFVRADAQIDAKIGRSNVEDVLDAAKYRTSGEVFLETEIPFENLAGQLPYRDFDVNSFVPVRLGGRILENQLVTKVEESEDEQGNRTATTYIGGQKFQDREALRTRNREIDRVIAQERLERGDEIGARLAASQEYEREQRDNLKEYVDAQDDKVSDYADDVAGTAEDNAKAHAEEEDKKLKRGVDLIIGPEGELTRQLQSLNEDYTAKLGENGSVIEDQAAHQRMLSGIVYGTPVSELEGTAFRQQQQAVNEMNDVFRNRQTSINKGFDYLFGLNEKINLAQDYTIAHHRILAQASVFHRIDVIHNLYPDSNGGLEGTKRGSAGGSGEVVDVLGNYADYDGSAVSLELNWGRFGGASAMSLANIGVFPRDDQEENVSYARGNWSVRLGTYTARRKGMYLRFQMDRGLGAEMIANGGCKVIVSGGVFFSGLTSLYQERIDALRAEYRAKGLRI